MPSIFHSLHISSANPASPPNLVQITSSLLVWKDHLIRAPFHLRISVSPLISLACLFSQHKATPVLFKAVRLLLLPTIFRSLFFSLSFYRSLSTSRFFLPFCLNFHFFPDLKDKALTLFLLCAPFQTLPSTVNLFLRRVVWNPYLSLFTIINYFLGSRYSTSQASKQAVLSKVSSHPHSLPFLSPHTPLRNFILLIAIASSGLQHRNPSCVLKVHLLLFHSKNKHLKLQIYKIILGNDYTVFLSIVRKLGLFFWSAISSEASTGKEIISKLF